MIIECKHCQILVDAQELANYEEHDPDGDMAYKYIFLKCIKCYSPILAKQKIMFPSEEWDPPESLYPTQDKIMNPSIPKTIRQSFQEATSCFKAKAYVATAIMCRKTLEGICAEHGIKERNLMSSLKEMKNNGIIENRLFEWSDALRILGNEAAHEVNAVISYEDARDLLEFSNAILEYVFTFRDKFEAFMQRRQNNQTTGSKT